MARTTDLQKKQFLKSDNITQEKYFSCSLNAYCKGNSLQLYTFKYWKNRLAKKLAESRLPVPSLFVPVKVSVQQTSASKKFLPDPKSLVEVLFELHVRLQ